MASEAASLHGKTALVTGAAKRLGAATALELARHGANVVIHYGKSQAEANHVAEQISALGVRPWTLPANLGDPEAAEGLFDRAVRLAGPIDILVNNASIFPRTGLATLSAADLHANIDVNALAPLLLSRRFFAQGRPGCVVNFLDARITDYDTEHAAYHLSKRMLFSLTRMMALEFAPAVRVNAVAPGLILPPEGEDQSYLERLAHTNPLGRHGDARDVTDAVLFLIRSEFVTGQVIFIDGGRHMKGALYGL
ncbi:MAG: SDR family oxidoreductase [Candidatus Hydrogenedentes bacterium]|nr:SDR family oxidoreductase [Candidatus Hydrogenedentota bacterium]